MIIFSRVSAKKILGVFFARKREIFFCWCFFFVFLWCFFAFGGVFLFFLGIFFVFRALARKIFGFIFRGGPRKPGNSRSAAEICVLASVAMHMGEIADLAPSR